MWHKLPSDDFMRTCEDNIFVLVFKKYSFIGKERHKNRGTELFGKVMKFRHLQLGTKSHNNFSINISKEIIKTVQTQGGYCGAAG